MNYVSTIYIIYYLHDLLHILRVQAHLDALGFVSDPFLKFEENLVI